MFEFDIIQSGLVITALFVLGEKLSKKLSGIIPAFLISGIVFMLLFWGGILPADLVARSKLDMLMTVGMMFIILSMGCNTSLGEMLKNWRVVLLAAVSYIFQLSMVLLVVGLVFGRNMALSAIPGSSAVAIMVQEQARAIGFNEGVLLSILLLFTNSMVACPIVAILIRKEASRLIAAGEHIRHSELAPAAESVKSAEGGSTYSSFLRFYIGAWISMRLAALTGIPVYVICLVLGVVFSELGFFRRNELENTGAKGFFFFMMMAMILNGFSASTPRMLLEMLLPICLVILTSVMSLSLASFVMGRILGFSPCFSVALGFNIMVGFPVNLMISQDMISYLTDDGDERSCLMEQIGNRMILAGFTSTTFLSNMLGGLLVSFMV